MIFEQSGFLDESTCDQIVLMQQNCPVDQVHHSTLVTEFFKYYINDPMVRYVGAKLTYFAQHNYQNDNLYPNYTHIVRWFGGDGQGKHKDFDNHFCTSIIYLNDTYSGGETVVEGTVIKPEKGKIVCFNGRELEHWVNDYSETHRYTLTTWYINGEEVLK